MISFQSSILKLWNFLINFLKLSFPPPPESYSIAQGGFKINGLPAPTFQVLGFLGICHLPPPPRCWDSGYLLPYRQSLFCDLQ